MRRKVEELVEKTLRPLVEADGGEITVLSVSEAHIEVHLSGACAGCPGLSYTRTEVLEPLIRQVVGEGPSLDIHSRRRPATKK